MENPIQESHIVHLIKSQDKEGFRILYDNYAGVFYGVICRTVNDTRLAEDILQEVFIKIWRHIDKYDESKGRLYTWMLQITRNTCIDHIRSAEYKKCQLVKTNEDGIKGLPGLKTREIDFGLKMLVNRLDPKLKDVIDKIFYGCSTYDEAAKELGIPLGTLKTRARTALLLLRGSLHANEAYH